MRLQRIRLRSYRGVDDADIRFDPHGVTVIEGDNEVGKTSLAEALRLACDFPDNSQAQVIANIQPKGLDVGPSVELELTTGGYQVSLRKQWLRENMTELRVNGRTTEQLSGRGAHDRLKQILSETVDEELWDVLRLAQGGRVTLPSFTGLATALDKAAAGTESSDQSDSLADRIEMERLRFWTPTGKVPMDRERKAQEVNDARERVNELLAQLEDVELNVARYEESAALAVQFGRQRMAADQRLQRVERDLAQTEKIEREAERWDAVVKQTQSERDLRSEQLSARDRLISRQTTLTTSLTDQSATASDAQAKVQVAQERLERAEAILASARENAFQRERDHAVVATHLTHLRLQSELDELRSRHARLLEAMQSFTDADSVVQRSAVDDEVLSRVEEAERSHDLANSAVQSAAFTVETAALQSLTLEVNGVSQALRREQVHVEIVEDQLELLIGEFARVRISASTDARALADKRDRAREAYDAVRREAGVTNVAAARIANRQLHDAEAERREAQAQISRELNGLSVEQLESDIAAHIEKVDGHQPDLSLPNNIEEAESILAERKIELDQAQAIVDEENQNFRNTSETRHRAEITAGALAKDRAQTATQLGEVEATLATARSEASDDILRTELSKAVAAAEEAQQASSETRDKLEAADPALLRGQREKAQTERDRASAQQEAQQRNQDELRGGLNQRGSMGLQTRLDEAQQRYAAVQRDYNRITQQAKAVELLSTVFAAHRQSARNRHSEPFQEKIQQLGSLVFGDSFKVEMDEELVVTSRTLDGTTLPVDQLSIGAQEQLGVICRLACAALVSPHDGGAPLIIDDALGWSDPDRLARMGEVFATAANEHCQVILLTCMPGRYAAVPNATVRTLTVS